METKVKVTSWQLIKVTTNQKVRNMLITVHCITLRKLIQNSLLESVPISLYNNLYWTEANMPFQEPTNHGMVYHFPWLNSRECSRVFQLKERILIFNSDDGIPSHNMSCY